MSERCALCNFPLEDNNWHEVNDDNGRAYVICSICKELLDEDGYIMASIVSLKQKEIKKAFKEVESGKVEKGTIEDLRKSVGFDVLLKQKALDKIAKKSNCKDWAEYMTKSKIPAGFLRNFILSRTEEAVGETLRVVFLWAEQKEKETKQEMKELQERYPTMKPNFDFDYGKFEVWRDLKQKLKE